MQAVSLTDRQEIRLNSSSPLETFAIGRKIAGFLLPGSSVALKGTLGSGKTELAKGIASGLGITENMTSPTYTIVNEYAFKRAAKEAVFFHIDVYRLNSEKDFEDIGGDEILNSGGICVIEWSDRILNLLPPDCINVSIEITGDTSRSIRITGEKIHEFTCD